MDWLNLFCQICCTKTFRINFNKKEFKMLHFIDLLKMSEQKNRKESNVHFA